MKEDLFKEKEIEIEITRPSNIKSDNEVKEKSRSESLIKEQEELKKKWEDHLDRKILEKKEYEKLLKKSRALQIIKYFLLSILFLVLIGLLVWFIFEFKNKDFGNYVEINSTTNSPVTINPSNVNANLQINQTNTNNIQLNATVSNINLNLTINIDKIIVNSTN